MKTIRPILVITGILMLPAFVDAQSTSAAATEAKPAAVPGVDPAATAIWAQHIEGMGDRGEGPRAVDYAQISGKAFEFFEKYPTERRVGGILYNLATCGEWMKGEKATELREGWQLHLRDALVETLKNPSWPDNIWAGLQWVAGKNQMAIDRDRLGQPDPDALKARIETVSARLPESPYRVFLEQEYLKVLETQRPAEVKAYLTQLSQSPITDLAALGAGQLAIHALREEPMELTFTALDGRKVDLAELRGKVVLIDCWATWCVPCVKELPNINAALAKWGPQGFTVVGVSFDRRSDRAKLVKFVEDEKLDWPHWYHEGEGSNPFGKRFNIRSIPATFLLGRDGRLISTDTHGEKLESLLSKVMAQ